MQNNLSVNQNNTLNTSIHQEKKRFQNSNDQSRINSNLGGGSDDEKSKFKEQKGEIKDSVYKTIEGAKKFLIEGNTSKAIDIALEVIKDPLVKKHLGEGSLHTLPAYFVLAEANIIEGMNNEYKLKRAEDYLIAAYWNFLKYNKDEENPDKGAENQQNEENDVQAKEQISQEEFLNHKITLHKIFSKLHLAQKEYQKSLDELKNAIYLESVRYGPEHIITSLSYYRAGDIFINRKSINEGEAFYQKTVQIWCKYLKDFFKGRLIKSQIIDPEELTIKEGLSNLRNIQSYFDSFTQSRRDDLYEIILKTFYTIGLCQKYLGDDDSAKEYLKIVIEEYEKVYGSDHQKTQRLYSYTGDYENIQKNDEQ